MSLIRDIIKRFKKNKNVQIKNVEEIKQKKKNKRRKLFKNHQLEKEKIEIEKYNNFLVDCGDNFEQKRAVVSDSKRILVLAGAGSGKTKVLTKRYVHLVKNKSIHRDKVLAVTFTTEAVKQMTDRVSEELNIKSEDLKKNIRTFHSLCAGILRQHEQFNIVDEKQQREIIENILYDNKDNQEIMESMYNYIKDNILEKVKSKDNKNSLYQQIKSKPFDIYNRKIKTKSGIDVRSKSERDIANFLTSLGVTWEYERPVNWADATFKPDFTVEEDIYIEHWAYNDQTPEFSLINKKKYLEHRRWKEDQFIKHKRTLISIEENEMLDLQKLQLRLSDEIGRLTKKKFQKEEIIDLLTLDLYPQYKKSYDHFIEEVIEIINLIKSRLMEIKDVKELVRDEEKEKVINFYRVLMPVMEEYGKILQRTDYSYKDFNDLIKDAVKLLREDDSRRKYYQNMYSFILVDEYQDVSYGEVELLKLLVNSNTSLFVVGDDWQSIYGWRGSDVSYILHFDDDFGDYERIDLPINYRSTKNIVDASSYFIQLKERQYKKDIKCCGEKEKDDSKIIEVNTRDDFQAAEYIVSTINQLKKDNNSLKDSDFLILKRSSKISQLYEGVLKKHMPSIKTKTIHWSKGTEFDYVFVLGLKTGIYGFPNIYADKDIKQVIMNIPIEDKEEEERRLFYVAMTRAKKKLFLITEKNNESEFVKEIPEIYKDPVIKSI